jgi:hypothetical protein
MRTPLRLLLTFTLILFGTATIWGQTIVNFDFGAVPIACSGYAYEWPVQNCYQS